MFRRSTDGSPAVSLGEARGGGALSPDGRWVLAELEGNLILLPTGAGSTVTLPKGDVVEFGRGAWLRDSKRIVFTGDDWRREAQRLHTGNPGRSASCDHSC